ncbi:NAD(P)/FAD-dependent oxidoreductase [Methylophilus aquaticus]|uniref:NAD(P)/FAD-dependent oxidoreductase n=1 Tax=Methylophilus aquaticus TaxID=1971610 RepID=A0ABT9JQL6_9PROT|nr:NAD(P)/FAD-dependent oxidoreductase [Methylophilus aquaticus]MDP8566848.1 NAD(P)/FAD-dependent oxidoreductase [Methylophilus aquaticus]
MREFPQHNLSAASRRQFVRAVIYGGLAFAGLPAFGRASRPPLGHVVVIGAGFAGLTAAKYLRDWSGGNIAVTLVEPNSQFVSCPQSNLVLGGSKTLDDLSFSYQTARKRHGINWVKDSAIAIDVQNRQLQLSRGTLAYDKLILAPGVDFDYSHIPGMAIPVADIPHAWKAGKQTLQLRQQLESMPDGGNFVMTIPRGPYRCPPGPYERACQVAHYFKQAKPRSKVIILDANPDITSKKGLFLQSFKNQYDGLIEYHNNSEIILLDPVKKTVKTDFEQVQADVLNVIPPQLAGKIAQSAGLNNVDQRWCEVDFVTYASSAHPDIHIIGDSISAGLPKSAHMATSQAKICAAAIVDMLAGQSPNPLPVFANTCYSFVDDKQAIHVANVYRYDAQKKTMVSAEGGGVSLQASVQEGDFAQAWAQNIWTDTLN